MLNQTAPINYAHLNNFVKQMPPDFNQNAGTGVITKCASVDAMLFCFPGIGSAEK
jgi:hypothetical protein